MFITSTSGPWLRTACRSAFAALLSFAIGAHPASAQGPESEAPPGPPILFSAPLPEMPGMRLVVVGLTLAPRRDEGSAIGHRHPGSVYVHVTEGTARLGLEGEPVREVRAGEGFFEPAGALHTVMESASATDPASAIAVMIVPEGAPLLTPER
jgi:quercetin dioxygenase-like cupin family protein